MKNPKGVTKYNRNPRPRSLRRHRKFVRLQLERAIRNSGAARSTGGNIIATLLMKRSRRLGGSS